MVKNVSALWDPARTIVMIDNVDVGELMHADGVKLPDGYEFATVNQGLTGDREIIIKQGEKTGTISYMASSAAGFQIWKNIHSSLSGQSKLKKYDIAIKYSNGFSIKLTDCIFTTYPESYIVEMGINETPLTFTFNYLSSIVTGGAVDSFDGGSIGEAIDSKFVEVVDELVGGL